MVSRSLRSAGHRVASLDIRLGEECPGKQNPMDLATPSGMALALATILNGKSDEFLAILAPVCSSFSGMNVAVHKRCALWPEGDTTMPSVRLGNLLCSRCCLLLLLITAMNGAWLLEQPAGSYMPWYQDLVEAFRQIGEVGAT
ncbi:unnamed protein product [Symbiodinium sp. CCMP2456]|nr:unnamed protein product [Symbiodinium sp. CCMP2456]